MDYDVSRIFRLIEDFLIASLIRNLERHRAQETKEGYDWEQWQAIQLRELEKYRKANREKFKGDFGKINKRVGKAFDDEYKGAKKKEKRKLLASLKTPKKQDVGIGFGGINQNMVDALIKASKNDLERGEQAILRKADDEYRRIIFNAEMFYATGGTYEQAVDMATKEMLKNGLRPIVYKNGSRHSLEEYARMAIRTGMKRAYLMGEGEERDRLGVHTVIVNKRTGACPLCSRWIGRVLVDDVYSHGTAEEAKKYGVPLLSQAMELGFLHPNCKDMYSTFIFGVSKMEKPWTKAEIKRITDEYNKEQARRYAKEMAEKYERMAKYSLDTNNKLEYESKAKEWEKKAKIF